MRGRWRKYKRRFGRLRAHRRCGAAFIFASFSFLDRGDIWVVYWVMVACRTTPRGVVSRGQVRTRLRLPLSPAAFLDRLEKGIKTKDILLQHLPSSTGPRLFCGSLCQDPCTVAQQRLRNGYCLKHAQNRWRYVLLHIKAALHVYMVIQRSFEHELHAFAVAYAPTAHTFICRSLAEQNGNL